MVGKTVNKVGLAQRYDRVAEQAGRLNLIGPEQSRVDRYVTGKTLDGLYTVIGEQERRSARIRWARAARCSRRCSARCAEAGARLAVSQAPW